jgi:uncharacterized protein (UPF0332 family)
LVSLRQAQYKRYARLDFDVHLKPCGRRRALNRRWFWESESFFYAASALLLTRDITRSKHSGVLSAFRQHFIKSGIIESEYSDIYGEAFDARHIADYDLIDALDPQEAHKTLTNASRFVARIETHLSKVGYK